MADVRHAAGGCHVVRRERSATGGAAHGSGARDHALELPPLLRRGRAGRRRGTLVPIRRAIVLPMRTHARARAS
jgi:hypothetical protein